MFFKGRVRFLSANYLECKYVFIFFLEPLRTAVLFVIVALSSQTFIWKCKDDITA